ncbi:MAG TPA: hypothetical protein VFM46_17500, partial [Pseudomonadales bacterium]|nr:hypothetical protein [Pseudomonadales bacterium]
MRIFSTGRFWSTFARGKSAQLSYRVIIGFLLLLSAQVSMAGATYFTGTDNENNAREGVPDYDMDVSIGTLDPNEPVEFNIDVTGEMPSSAATLSIRAFDVDSTKDVYHYVFLNGVKLGRLVGAADTWSITKFKVPLKAVHPGHNTVMIMIDGWNQGFRTEIDWGELNIDNEPAGNAELSDITIDSYTVDSGNVTVNAETTVKVQEAGDYLVEFNLVYPNSARSNVVIERFSAAAGEELLRHYAPVFPLNSPSGTYTIDAFLFKDNQGQLEQQDMAFTTFKHEQGVVPSLIWAISASPLSVLADGQSAAVLTVQAQDADGNKLS